MFEMDEIYERMSEFATLQYNQRGTYVLVMQCRRAVKVQIGQLSNMCMEIGWYLYIGSAFGSGGLKARVGRHLREQKKKHWHIDYLLEESVIKDVFLSREEECDINRDIFLLPNAIIISNKFGSSDCSCESHLAYFKDQKSIPNNLEKMEVLL